MAVVNIQGQFLGAKLDKKTFDGVEKISVLLDIYQPTSNLKSKNVTVKVDEIEMLDVFNKTYNFGDTIQVQASVNAYRNDAYYKFLDLVS